MKKQAPHRFPNSGTYKLKMDEFGTEFEETVHVDVTRNLEQIHVPRHGDIQDTYFLIDYNMVRTLNNTSV